MAAAPTEKAVKAPKRDKKIPDLSPAYIAQMREKRKEKKLKAKTERGDAPEEPSFDTHFIRRPLLRVPDVVPYDDSPKPFKIMTYNVLAQALIQRKLFPDNGDILKWKNRHLVLAEELKHYNPDILCLQEVDSEQVTKFWGPLLKELGHQHVFTTFPSKSHGLIISYNAEKFTLKEGSVTTLFYDEISPNDILPQVTTRNNGMILALHINGTNKGIILGNTHMFWHAKGSYERTRQMAILLQHLTAIKQQEEYKSWYAMLAGDFNSECFDTPYLCATLPKPVNLDEDARRVLAESLSADNFGLTISDDGEEADHKKHAKTIAKLVELFDKLPYAAKSIYASHYGLVHPENQHPKGKGEPNFSNWAYAWRGLLDYIFVLDSEEGDGTAVEHGEVTHGCKVLELLRMPIRADMGPLPNSQPRDRMYPSDHLSLMATIQLK